MTVSQSCKISDYRVYGPFTLFTPATCVAAVVRSASIRLTPAESDVPPFSWRYCVAALVATSAEEHAVSMLTCTATLLTSWEIDPQYHPATLFDLGIEE